MPPASTQAPVAKSPERSTILGPSAITSFRLPARKTSATAPLVVPLGRKTTSASGTTRTSPPVTELKSSPAAPASPSPASPTPTEPVAPPQTKARPQPEPEAQKAPETEAVPRPSAPPAAKSTIRPFRAAPSTAGATVGKAISVSLAATTALPKARTTLSALSGRLDNSPPAGLAPAPGPGPGPAPSTKKSSGPLPPLSFAPVPSAEPVSAEELPSGAERRALLKKVRAERRRRLILYGLFAVVFFGLLGIGIFYYVMSLRESGKVPETTTPAGQKTPGSSSSSTNPSGQAGSTASSPDPKAVDAVNQGLAQQKNGDVKSAIPFFTNAITIDPQYAQAFSYRAAARQSTGDLPGALADDNQLVKLEPDNANAFSQRGFVKQSMDDLDGAIADYTRAIELDPKSFVDFYNRGLIREQKGDSDAAIADYNQALELNPKLAGAYYNRGNAKTDKNDLDGAIADYTRALELNPKIALAYCYRGLAEQNTGNLNGALTDYDEAIALDPKIGLAYYNRGLIREQRNDLDGAIADSTKALGFDPKNAQAYYNRGVALQAKGQLDAANADLRKFVEIAPKGVYADYAYLYLWVISSQLNQKAAADQALAQQLETTWNAEPEELPSKIASFLLDKISESDLMAAAVSSDAKKDQGQHCEAWYFDGMKKLLTGDKAAAIDCFQRCITTGQKDFCEYILAQAELQSLGEG
jgi:tetratricopeptide (TPR) repeat protein